jgi:hypothetical protein
LHHQDIPWLEVAACSFGWLLVAGADLF